MVTLCSIDLMLAEALTEFLPQSAPFSLSDAETAYKEVYDAGTALNREIAIVNAQTIFEGEKPARTASCIDYELAAILAAEEKQHTYQVLKEKYEKDLQNQKRIRREIQDVEDRIRAVDIDEPDADEKQRLQEERVSLQEQANAIDIAGGHRTYSHYP